MPSLACRPARIDCPLVVARAFDCIDCAYMPIALDNTMRKQRLSTSALTQRIICPSHQNQFWRIWWSDAGHIWAQFLHANFLTSGGPASCKLLTKDRRLEAGGRYPTCYFLTNPSFLGRLEVGEHQRKDCQRFYSQHRQRAGVSDLLRGGMPHRIGYLKCVMPRRKPEPRFRPFAL